MKPNRSSDFILNQQNSQNGQGLTEYLVLVLLIAVACIGVTQTLGKAIKARIEDAKEKVNGLRPA